MGHRKEMWQCAWLEQILNAQGNKILGIAEELGGKLELFRGDIRVAFFMHYIDLARPLITPFGTVRLPKPRRLPRRLSMINYEEPE
jgi:hypothetical protein